MRKFLVLALFLLLGGAAFAQPPQEITANDSIEMQVGEARAYLFDQPVGTIKTTLDGIVVIVPESDRQFIFRAQKPGIVQMTAYAPDGKLIHRSNLVVGGRLVKLYGTEHHRGKSGRDYISYLCTRSGCGRADFDLRTNPTGTIITESRPNEQGGTTTTTEEYR